MRLAEVVASAEGLVLAHRTEVLSIAVWKFTEADGGKYGVRYRTPAAAFADPPAEKVQHEHVITRKSLVAQMLREPDEIPAIMATALACLVTKDEHQLLMAAEKAAPELTGWQRYQAAGLDVIDMATGQPLW